MLGESLNFYEIDSRINFVKRSSLQLSIHFSHLSSRHLDLSVITVISIIDGYNMLAWKCCFTKGEQATSMRIIIIIKRYAWRECTTGKGYAQAVSRISKQIGCYRWMADFYQPSGFTHFEYVVGSLTWSLPSPRIDDNRVPKVRRSVRMHDCRPKRDAGTLRLTSVYAAVTTQNCHYDEFDRAQCYQQTEVLCNQFISRSAPRKLHRSRNG